MRQAEKKIKGDKKMANIIKFEEKYSEQVYNLFMNVRDEIMKQKEKYSK